jgi:hypothetical protein
MKIANVSPVLLLRSSSWVALSLVTTVGALVSCLSQPGVAQVANQLNNANPLQSNPQMGDGNTDPFSSRGDNQFDGVLDLMHRAMMGNIRSSEEFQQSQQNDINSAASDFRTRQLELLRQQNQPQATSPVVSPSMSIPAGQ